MKRKIFVGIFVLLVSVLVLISNALGSAIPPVWLNQATLSVVDGNTSEDPENSGFNTDQVVVWQEWNGVDWDIYLKFSRLDGALGSWVFPVFHPATTGQDEINPAVTVNSLAAGPVEIHVVYQCWNPGPPAQWDICHTWTNNFGGGWIPPVVLDVVQARDAIDPAIVSTQDLNFPGVAGPGLLVQFVWSEWNPNVVPARYEIQYDAFYYDPNTVPPTRAYVGPTLIRTTAIGSCWYPEIASVDERLNAAAYDYYFSIVWEEPTIIPPAILQTNVLYVAGTTAIAPGPPGTVVNAATLGQLNPVNVNGDCYHPDIAATQDYPNVGVETYYFHVNWVYNIWANPGPPPTPPFWQIDTCYYAGPVATPGGGGAPFIATASAKGPVLQVLDNPTIASKMIPVVPVIFETWMCWEDNTNPASPPDIWYRIGQYNTGAPPFGFTIVVAMVPYVQGASTEFNPELWNRNDISRPNPVFTHLVFDMTQGVAQEVEYIDP